MDNGSTAEPFNPALPPAGMDFGAPAAAAPLVQPAEPITDTHNLLETQADDGYTEPVTAGSNPAVQGAPDPAFTASAPVQSTQDDTRSQGPTLGTPSPLHDLKQQALQQLTPLVGQLEQSAEERFRTTMMMIQASDNQDLLHTAYDAANQIEDEKVRAQALLDVINEINYFAQQQNG